jgi:hypothetical protein
VGQHEPGVDAGLLGQEGGEALRPGGVHHPVGAPLGDGRQVGEGDGAEIGGEGEGLAVEVAGRGHLAAIDQHDRVVGHGGQLPFHHRPGVADHVAGGAVDLGGAAQRIGVLHGMVGRAVAGDDLRPGQEAAQIGGAALLAGVGTDGVELGTVGGVGAEEGLHGDGAGHVGRGGQPVEVGHGQAQVGQHPFRAVEERQALLGLEDDRREAGGGQRLGPRAAPSTGVERFAGAREDGPDMRQRGEVTRGAEAAELGHHRGDARGEKTGQRLHQDGTGPRQPGGQGAGPQQHHRPDDFRFHGVAHAGGVAQHQGQLEPPGLGR